MSGLKRITSYTDEQIDYLRKMSAKKGMDNKKLTKLFNEKYNQNRTYNAIMTTRNRNNIKFPSRDYTKEQINYLKEIVPGRTYKEATKLFNKRFNENKTQVAIKSVAFANNIKTGNTGRFKGYRPANAAPVGAERTKSGFTYVKIKEPRTWKPKHHIIWEEVNGSLPEDHVILFGDGDKSNFDIDNLILASKAQLLQLNRYDLMKEDAELTRTGLIIADLYMKIGKMNKIRRENNG